MQQTFLDAGALADLLGSTLDEIDSAVVIAREGASVLAMNAAARALLGGDDSLVMRDGALQLRLHSEQMQLRTAIARAISTREEQGDACLGASRRAGRRPLVLRVRRIGRGDQTAAAIFIADPDRSLRESACHLRVVYDLTRSELRVVRELMRGSEPEKIAATLSVTTHTVRTHLRNIFAKTGARGQADLIRLVARIPTFLRDADRAGDSATVSVAEMRGPARRA
jgi:DNA-binding CsgD family transcriptional regulator